MRIKLVTFDITNTVIRFRKSPPHYYKEISAHYGVILDEKKVSQCFKQAFKENSNKFPNFGANADGWKSWWTSVIKNTINGCCKDKVKSSVLSDISQNLINLFSTSKPYEIIPGFLPVVKELSECGLVIGALSNTDERLESILLDFGIKHYFNFILPSYIARIQKPDPKFFECALKHCCVGISPSQALHIGDNIHKDFIGARNAGWNSILVASDYAEQCKQIDVAIDTQCMVSSMFNLHKLLRSDFLLYCLKTVTSAPLSNISRSFSPSCKLYTYFNHNIRRKTSFYLCKKNISTILEENASRKKHFFLQTLLTLSFSIPFFGIEPKEEETEETKIVMIMKRAILAKQRGDAAKAEQLLHLALKSAQETDNNDAITYIYDLLANFALENQEYEKAEKLFVNTLKRFLQNGMSDDDNALVEVSLKLASIYSHLGDNEKACQGFQFCIGTQEKKLKSLGEENVDEDTFVLWAMSHDWFARFLLTRAHYDRAKEHFKRAYDVCVKVKGTEDPQVAILLNDLGSVCSLQQNYDEAIDFFNKAIGLAKIHENEELASFYVNLGTVYMQKNAFEEAELYCKNAAKIAKGVKNEEALNESVICLQTLKKLRK